MAKTFHIMSPGQKLARLEKEYLPSGWSIWMTDAQEGDLLARKRISKNSNIWL